MPDAVCLLHVAQHAGCAACRPAGQQQHRLALPLGKDVLQHELQQQPSLRKTQQSKTTRHRPMVDDVHEEGPEALHILLCTPVM